MDSASGGCRHSPGRTRWIQAVNVLALACKAEKGGWLQQAIDIQIRAFVTSSSWEMVRLVMCSTPSKDRTESWLMRGCEGEVAVGGGEHPMFLVQVGCWSAVSKRPCLGCAQIIADGQAEV